MKKRRKRRKKRGRSEQSGCKEEERRRRRRMPYARENEIAENRLLFLPMCSPGSPLGPFFPLLPKRAERIRQTSIAQA